MILNLASISVLLGLASALSWGSGDFCGGLASRQSNIYTVTIFSQIVGLALLFALALILNEPLPALSDLILGGIAGISGSFGILMLYRAMLIGAMGVAAPISAVIAAAIPVIAALFLEGLPSSTQTFAMGFGLLAVWLLAGNTNYKQIHWNDLNLPILAGVGFAGFFLIIDQVSGRAVLWPLVAARLVSTLFLFGIALQRRRFALPERRLWPLILLTGVFEIGGNVFFALATRFGRLDLAAVLASLYPAATVLLARIFINENLQRLQWFGVLAALIALAFFAI